MPTIVDLTDDTASLLDAVRRISVELNRRDVLEHAEDQVNAVIDSVSQALGRVDGSQWVQPTGAHDAYPIDAVVTDDGVEWVNVVPANVWRPGVAGWRVMVDAGEVAPWVQPLGYHDAYSSGDRVEHGGTIYTSTADGNGWEPGTVADVWTSGEEPVEPDTYPDYLKPAGAHDAPRKGDRFMWQGFVVESLIDGNVWTPDEYPQAWKIIT